MNSELEPQGKTTAQLNNVRYIQQVQSMPSEFDKHFTDFASVEPIATYMCFPFATDIDVDDIASKMGALFQLDTTAVENKILSLQNDIQIKSRATTERGEVWFLVYWGLTPQQQPGSYQGGEMMMTSVLFWWRKPEYPEETTDLRQVTDETVHTYGLCPVRGVLGAVVKGEVSQHKKMCPVSLSLLWSFGVIQGPENHINATLGNNIAGSSLVVRRISPELGKNRSLCDKDVKFGMYRE